MMHVLRMSWVEIKRYLGGEDDYVMLEEDEIEAVALESTRTIDIELFAPQEDIEWIWLDKPPYLTPDDPVGEEAFAVIRDAMATTQRVGIARLVMYRRERAVMLEPHDTGVVVWTLCFGDEVRDPGICFDDLGDVSPDRDTLQLMQKLIDGRTKSWSPEMVRDPVQERLLEIIAAKKKGRRQAMAQPKSEVPGKVVSIMDALRRSLAREAQH